MSGLLWWRVEYPASSGGGATTFVVRPGGIGRSRVHTVDVGDVSLGSTETHQTRDGLPMVVLYAEEHGYSVGVDTRGAS